MKTKTKIAIGLTVGLLAAVLILGYLFLSGSVYLTRDLRRGEVEVNDDVYYLEFFQGKEETKTASVYIRIGRHNTEGLYSMLIQICHKENTALDGLSLKFNSLQPVDALAFRAPEGYPWPTVEYHASSTGREVLYSIRDFGFQGTGTINIEFLLDADILQPLPSNQLYLDVDFTMYREGLLKFTRQRGEGTICLEGLEVPLEEWDSI
jgi:hypothetical protein